MKKQLMFSIMCCLITAMMSYAQGGDVQEISGYCGKDGDNIKWTVNTIAGTLVLEGTGEMAEYSYVGEQPWMAYKSHIGSISVGEGITSITNNAFANMSFGAITLPSTLESIGTWVFQNDKEMKHITLPTGLKSLGSSAFAGSGIEAITIPSAITAIPSNLCWGCDGLRKIIIPEQVMAIGSNAFAKCSSLAEVALPEGLTSIGEYAFEETAIDRIVIPAAITSLGTATFSGCSNLKDVVLPDALQTIGKSCFYQCTSLESFILNEQISIVSNNAFQGCTGLKKLEIKGTPTLCDYAFSGCTSLSEVILPDDFNDSNLRDYVFSGCTSLPPLYNSATFFLMPQEGYESYTIPDGITSIAKYAFAQNLSLMDIKLPSTIKSIGSYAFYFSCVEDIDLTNLEYVSLGEGAFSNSKITNITSSSKIANCPPFAFDACPNLKEIDLTGMRKAAEISFIWDSGIGNFAFRNCKNLTKVVMPSGGEWNRIGRHAFMGCSNLETFDFSNVYMIDACAFMDCTSLKEFVASNYGGGVYINDHTFGGCTSLGSVVFGSSGCQQFFMSAFEGCTNLKTIEIYSENIPKIFDLQQAPYNGLWESGFDSFDLPYSNVKFKMFGYLADDLLTGSDMEFWNKVQFEKIYEELSGTCGDNGDNIKWELDTKSRVLKITGQGNMLLPEDAETISWRDRKRAIQSIELSDGIESICNNAFSYCSIKTVTLNHGLKSIGKYAFAYTDLESVDFNDELTSIDDWAFGNCTYLQEIVVCNSVREMGGAVFSSCGNLLKAVLPPNLETLGQATFNQCPNLKSVTLPKRIAYIPDYTFGGCWNITDIYLPACTPPTGSGGLGGIYNNQTIHIPQGTEANYKNSMYWKTLNMDEYYAYINVNNNGGGKLRIGSETLEAGNWDDYLVKGDEFAINVEPDDYYDVSSVVVNGTDALSSLSDNLLKFDNLQESKSIKIAFAPVKFTITVDVQGRGHVYLLGHDVELSGTFEVTHNDQIDITVSPNEGYKMESASLNDADITKQMAVGYALYYPTQNMTVKVSFCKDHFKLTYMIDDEVYKETEYEYEAIITPEPVPTGDYSSFEWIGLPEKMPAHDVVVYASYETAICEVATDSNQPVVGYYDIKGEKLERPLLHGITIVRYANGSIRKIIKK